MTCFHIEHDACLATCRARPVASRDEFRPPRVRLALRSDFRLKKGAIQSNTEKSVKKVTRKRKGINAHPANSHQAGTMIKVRPWSTVTVMVCSQRRSRDRLRLRFHARLAGATLLSHVRAAHVASRLFRLPRAISGAQCGYSAPAWLQTLAPRCCAFPHLAPHLS